MDADRATRPAGAAGAALAHGLEARARIAEDAASSGGGAWRLTGGAIALVAGLLGIAASVLDLDLIDALNEMITALGVFDAGAISVLNRAHAAVASADGALALAALTVVFAALAILLRQRWPGAGILVSAVAGSLVGGPVDVACMVLAMAGGVLVVLAPRGRVDREDREAARSDPAGTDDGA
jgi:hypothetical protein